MPAVSEPLDQVPATAPAGPADNQGHRGRRSWALAAAAVVLLGGAATVVGVATRSDRTASPVASGGTATPAVATWLRGTLDPAATVTTDDPDLRERLAAGGVDVALTAPAAAAPGSYLLRTAPAGVAGPTATAVAGDRTFVPVARFTDGTGVVEVGQLVDRPVADLTRDRDAERATARAATAGLLDNPALTVASDVRTLFEAGDLDLRAAAFLAVLATAQPVQVLAVPVDPAERAAGVAARVLAVTVTDPAALRDDVARASGSYAPVVTAPAPGTDLPTGSLLLTWPLLADPTLVVT